MLSTHPPPAYDEENEWSRKYVPCADSCKLPSLTSQIFAHIAFESFEIADVKDESTSDDPNEIPLPIRDIDVSQVYGLQIVKVSPMTLDTTYVLTKLQDGLNALGVQTDDAFARHVTKLVVISDI